MSATKSKEQLLADKFGTPSGSQKIWEDAEKHNWGEDYGEDVSLIRELIDEIRYMTTEIVVWLKLLHGEDIAIKAEILELAKKLSK